MFTVIIKHFYKNLEKCNAIKHIELQTVEKKSSLTHP